jgi:hypothetical protein
LHDGLWNLLRYRFGENIYYNANHVKKRLALNPPFVADPIFSGCRSFPNIRLTKIA